MHVVYVRMYTYDPNNSDLLNDIKAQYQQELNLKYKEAKKIEFKKYFPLINFDNLEELKLSGHPRNGCSAYYKDNTTNKIYGHYTSSSWKEETNNYDWNKILQSGTFLYF